MLQTGSRRAKWRNARKALLVALSVAGCASSPENIKPTYTSEDHYLGLTCEQLGQESQRLNDALKTASEKQKSASSKDALGVFLIGMPLGSMSGEDIGPEVARLKGEVEAVQRAQNRKGCSESKSNSTSAAPSTDTPAQ